MIQITVPDLNDSIGRIELNGVQFFIRFTYNTSYDYWSFGFYDKAMKPLLPMHKIVPNYSLTDWYTYTDFPQGSFGTVTSLDRIGRKDFLEERAKFYFATKEEVEEYLANA